MDETKMYSRGTVSRAMGSVKRLALYYMDKYQVLNFMVVGGIGFVINMLIYWPLTMVFKTQTGTYFGQHFYLPPFLISSLIAIICNYTLNKAWTFKDQEAHSLSFLRYLSMALVTLALDMALLYVLVDYGKLAPMLGAALAIMIVFVVRYMIAKHWIWGIVLEHSKRNE
jgi:putative flippase GtrA